MGENKKNRNNELRLCKGPTIASRRGVHFQLSESVTYNQVIRCPLGGGHFDFPLISLSNLPKGKKLLKAPSAPVAFPPPTVKKAAGHFEKILSAPPLPEREETVKQLQLQLYGRGSQTTWLEGKSLKQNGRGAPPGRMDAKDGCQLGKDKRRTRLWYT